MGIRFRKRVQPRIGGFKLPVYWNLSRRGVSTTFKVGPWSRNSRTKRARLDLPGPLYWEGEPARRHSTDDSTDHSTTVTPPQRQGSASPVSWSWLLGVVAVGVLGWLVVALFGWSGLWSALRWGW